MGISNFCTQRQMGSNFESSRWSDQSVRAKDLNLEVQSLESQGLHRVFQPCGLGFLIRLPGVDLGQRKEPSTIAMHDVAEKGVQTP